MFSKIWGFLAPLFNERGQIPSSVTDNYDALLSSTLRAYSPKLRDNVSRGNKFLAYLDSKGRFRKQDGGFQVTVPLMHQQNGTADIYSGYGLLDTTPQDGITTALYDWSQLSVSIAISRKEERQNSGKHKILDLLKAKTMQAEVSLKQLLNDCLITGRITTTAGSDQIRARIGGLDSGALGPLPLGALIDITADRSVSLGNINGNTYSFWRNQSRASSASSFVTLKNEMNRTYNDCSKGTTGLVDFLIGDQIAWEEYWLALQQNERYIIDDKKTIDILGGSDGLKFRGAIFVWDETVPDPETPYNPVDASGTAGLQHGGSATVSTIYFVNSESIDWVTDSQTDFITTDFVRPENQDAKVAQILWMGAVGVNNRRKNGVLYSISQAITA